MQTIKNILLIIFIYSVFVSYSYASQLIIKSGSQTVRINSLNIRGIEYVSVKNLAKALGSNYYYNSERQKSEIKFTDYKLKFTANNQFVILISKKSNQHQIFQMPVSSRLRKGDVYIPIKYSVKYISYASGLETIYLEEKNILSVLEKKIDTKDIVSWNNNLVDRTSVLYDIFSVKVENKSNGTLIRFTTKRTIRKPSSSIRDNVLYLFFSDVTIDKSQINGIKSIGFVKSVVIKYVAGNPQLEIKLKEGYDKYEIFYDDEIGELLVSIHNKYLKKEDTISDEIEKWKFDVIVLDAGHGGKDPGAIGVNGLKEKNINLAIVKELGKLIENKLKDVKVVYTRNDDRFVELYKRGKIANANNGNLFISVHCNSTSRKFSSARGFEVYLLRPGKTKKAIDIAEFENSVISLEDDPTRYKQLNDENFILVSMAHASYMRYSETFADMMNTEWIKQVNIPSRGIKQAGFYVLVGASMPGILIETGFISNKHDAKYLSRSKGQIEIASSIFSSILKYKKYYETSLNNEID